MAARITPVVATTVHTGCVLNDPARIRNSPTNPLSPGSPTDDSTAMTKNVAYSGIVRAIPP